MVTGNAMTALRPILSKMCRHIGFRSFHNRSFKMTHRENHFANKYIMRETFVFQSMLQHLGRPLDIVRLHWIFCSDTANRINPTFLFLVPSIQRFKRSLIVPTTYLWKNVKRRSYDRLCFFRWPKLPEAFLQVQTSLNPTSYVPGDQRSTLLKQVLNIFCILLDGEVLQTQSDSPRSREIS